MRTSDATSPTVATYQVVGSIAMFVGLFAVLSWIFFRLLDKRIKAGFPEPQDEATVTSLPNSFGEIFGRRSRISEGVS